MGKRKERFFRMKEFSVKHEKSPNKVGVDGVLIGAWADYEPNPQRILDVGCGCGIITLMMAQRYTSSHILGIDLDTASAEEASENCASSSWSERIKIMNCDFNSLIAKIIAGDEEKFDLVVSNPPFFNSGVSVPKTPREIARHTGALSPEVLIRESIRILSPGGRLALIAPAEEKDKLLVLAGRKGYKLVKSCVVKGNPEATPKRVMLQWSISDQVSSPVGETLIIETSPGDYTPAYRELCHRFYLRF